MKRLFFALLIVALAGAAFAEAPKEITVASGNSSVPNTYITVGKRLGTEPDIWAVIAEKKRLKGQIPKKLVVHEDRTDLKRLKDIDGLKCGYSSGSNGGTLFKQIAEKEGIKVELVVYDSSDLLNEAFRQEKVDVMIFAWSEAAFKIKNGYLKARTVEENITVGEKVFPFRCTKRVGAKPASSPFR